MSVLIKLIPAKVVTRPMPGYYYQWPDRTIKLCVALNSTHAHFAGAIGTPPAFVNVRDLPLLTEMKIVHN